MWLDCGLDLVAIREELQNSSCNLQDGPYMKSHIEETINLLTPKVDRAFLDCLIKHNFPVDVSGEDTLRSWFADYLEFLVGQFSDSRRRLADKPSHEISSPAPPVEHGGGTGMVIIAVALTAAITSTSVACIFICLIRCQRNSGNSSLIYKDDRPLLSLCLSNFTGSSHKSFKSIGSLGTTNSILAPPKPLKTDESLNLKVSSLDSLVETSESPPFDVPSGT